MNLFLIIIEYRRGLYLLLCILFLKYINISDDDDDDDVISRLTTKSIQILMQ